jgi:hypothetical protein
MRAYFSPMIISLPQMLEQAFPGARLRHRTK